MKPASPEICLEAQQSAVEGVDDALRELLGRRAIGPAAPMYKMLQYFMGFLDEKFQEEATGAGGKRFRPALCLFIAEGYGARDEALNSALAIELFHNFTLIHDDVEDRDEVRRNRPTVWKLWGVNQAINSGDMQSLLLSELCVSAGPGLGLNLLSSFEEVIEGQYLDFELADQPIGSESVSEERALLVAQKKTGALIAAAAECAGIAARQSIDERERLHAYGIATGMVFQLADDYRSIWETKKSTGKDTHSDIREHKRTLPFFAAYKELEGDAKKRLAELYGLQRRLSEPEITEALSIINSTEARSYTLSVIRKYAADAKKSAEKLSGPDEMRAVLTGLVDMLVPEES
jgi:geranylgeranyl diphosphate synthase, type I